MNKNINNNRCDYCQNSIDSDTFICSHQITCIECITNNKCKFYKDLCIYCIMEQEQYYEDYESLALFSKNLKKIFEYGREDGYNNINQKYYKLYNQKISTIRELLIKIYSDGYLLGNKEFTTGNIIYNYHNDCNCCCE